MPSAHRLSAFGLTALIAACAATPELPRDPGQAGVPVTSYAEMKVQPLRLDEPATITLDAGSPSYAFAEGKAAFAAAALPASDQPRHVTFESAPFGGMLGSQLKVLVPRFDFLDGDRQVLNSAVPDRLQRNYGFMRNTTFGGRVSVPRDARYVVVRPAASTPMAPILYGENGRSWVLPLAPLGTTSVTVRAGALATIADSGMTESGTTAQLFMVAAIDDKPVDNASTESARASRGTGFALNTVFAARDVPARPLKVKLVGTHTNAAPIQSIFKMASGSFLSVEGTVDFTPEPDGRYVVKGQLRKEGSAVWIEEMGTGRVVTERVMSH